MTNNSFDAKSRLSVFRQTIAAFIEERKEAKLKGLGEDAAEQTAAKYDYHTWLADAARRVAQIRAVTHVLKATHPDARGTNLYINPEALPPRDEIGTHILGQAHDMDVVGNAAALDVYKFLKLEVEGRRLLDWLLIDDKDLLAALHSDPDTAQQWAIAFKGLLGSTETLASHTLAKQVYWCTSNEPTNDSAFHLLQPLASSSLAQAVHREIDDARFGEANKEARQAFRGKQPHDAPYREYRGLVARKLGGTKPQNISQLNSERRGVNYLLASLPPRWTQNKPRHFLSIDSALGRLRRFEGVNEQLNALRTLLKNEPAPTMETRAKREHMERALGQSLAAFGLFIRTCFQPGWTRDDRCSLPLCEQIWLDPGRLELPLRQDHLEEDVAFNEAAEWKDWPDEVAHRFGNWLNVVLQGHGLPMGDAEHAHWARQAIIDAEWPSTMKRHVSSPGHLETPHG